MLLAIILSFLQMVTASDSRNLLSESKSQAKYYINQIESGENIEENIWALSILGSENDELKIFIEKRSQSNRSLTIFNDFEGNLQSQLTKAAFQIGSSNLLIAALLTTDESTKKQSIYDRYKSKFDLSDSQDINYQKLCEAIINEKEITRDILSNRKFLLPHFFILFNDKHDLFFSDDYILKIIQSWTSDFSSSKNLNSMLSEASYFRTLYITDKYSETDSIYHTLINNKLFPNSSIKLQIYRYLDYSMYRLGYFDRNLEIARTFTLPLSKYLNRRSLQLQIKYSLGINLYNIGKIKQAEKIYQEILSEAQKNNTNIPLSSIYNNLALAYYKSGQYEKYLNLQFQALETAQTENNYNHQTEILNNLFIYYRKSNDEQNALNYLEKAQELAERENNTSDLGTIYMLAGSYYREFNSNFIRAHNYFSKAQSILSSKDNTKEYLELLNEQAETFEAQQKYDQAIKKHNQIVELTNEDQSRKYIDAIINKALVNLKMNNNEEAENFISEYKSLALNQLDFQQIIKAKTVEADYIQRMGNFQEAIDILEPTLDQVVARAKSSADLKSGFWHVEDEFLDAFELVVSIYQKRDQPEQAIQKLDQFKTINDASLYQNPLVKSSLLNESELTQYKQLTDQLDEMRKKLLIVSEDRQFGIQQTISQLNAKKSQLDQKLTREIDSDPITIREIQNRLSARELMLHITELNDQYYVARISRSDVSINTIPLDSTFRNLLSGSVQQIATNETDLDSLYKITKALDLQEIPDRIEEITLVPDSYFYQLPIDILPLEKPVHSYSYGEATYAVEKFRTQYLTSLEDFKSDTDKPSTVSQNKLSYTGYGVSNFDRYNRESLVSLPFAQTEVTNIAGRLTELSDVQTFINEQSTKSTFERTAPQSQIIHLATHSEVSERDPMFSTVYLSHQGQSADSTFDSQIFAYELFELDLSNEMIMLNSCESGSGPYIQGTGIMGMSRALRYAGANSLVLNLWSVNDMLASDFAVHFYDQLNEGKTKTEALRDTKRYFLSSKNASPHFWGPYMLIGNPNPIVQPNQDENMAMAGAFIFYFLLMIGLSYLTQQGFIFKNKQKEKAA